MTERDRRESVTESCPNQEVDVQENCDPCGATVCETEDTGCATCE